MENRVIVRVAVDTELLSVDKLYDYRVSAAIREKVRPGMRVLVPFGKGNNRCEALILKVTGESSYSRLKTVDALLDTEPVLDEERLRLALYLRDRLFCPLYRILRVMLPSGLWCRIDSVYHPAPERDRDSAAAAVVLIPEAEKLVDFLWSAREPVPARRLASLLPEASLQAALTALTEEGYLIAETFAGARTKDKTTRLFKLSADGRMAAGTPALRSRGQKDVVAFLEQSEKASVKEICYYTGVSDSVVNTLFKRGLLEVEEQETFFSPTVEGIPPEPPEIRLNEEQKRTFEGLRELQESPMGEAALLFGVTGSGKTSVYIKLIAETLEKGRDSILLVPEISLTPQMLQLFYMHFGQTVAVLHSGMSVRERYDSWRRIQRGDARVVIGTRSAVFAPVVNLGLLIIDEEHDHSYKSDTVPRYHARDAAKYRCYRNQALLVLGSATPSVVSMYQAKSGRMHLFTMERRYGGAELPDTIIADSRAAFRQGIVGNVGPVLLNHLRLNLDNGEQSILFLNRRGASRELICMDCGHVTQCQNCSVPLAYHRANGRLVCHQCGYSIKVPKVCPQCGRDALTQRGAGTQEIERELTEKLPDVRIIRMDSDTTAGKNTHSELLTRFGAGEADVLVGTQMVTKGLNFPNVTLVGVVDADMSLHGWEYTCGEDTFNLITQVVGRAGRSEKPGRAVIQTAAPMNSVITAAAAQDYRRFYEEEIELRRVLRQPPYARLVQFMVSGVIDEEAYDASRRFRDAAVIMLSQTNLKAELAGPAAAPILRLNNRYRYTLTMRLDAAENEQHQNAMIVQLLRDFYDDRRNQKIHIDIDVL
ncbi:MAG: primosomal protein N' [Ruminococcaceae bacterium]|nr:primosomal protein N' [Oscillospiraceae bacterium]